jgi:capsular exopolysaccharide synthesis family protein
VDLNELLRVLRDRWHIVACCLLLGLVGAGVATALMPREYAAQVTMYVSAPSPDPTAPGATVSQDAAYQGSLLAKDRMQSYALLLTNERITRRVIETLSLATTPVDLASRIEVSAVPDTVVLSATVTDENPTRAADIANALSKEFVGLVDSLERRPGAPTTPVEVPLPGQIAVQVVQAAVPSPQPVAPRPAVAVLLGALSGLLLGLVGAFLRNAVDNTVRSRETLRDLTGLPVLAVLPGGPPRGRLIQPGSRSPRAEAVRLLRTNLRFRDSGRDTRVLVLTGPATGEGTTTTLCNVAIAMAEADIRVLVIDADLREPTVASVLGLPASPGLADVLAGKETLGGAVRAWQKGGVTVDVLPSGLAPHRTSELLARPRLAEVLDEARKGYDLVLVDTPALLRVADAATLVPLADGVLLAVRYGRTTTGQVVSATEEVAAVSGRLVGAVLVRVPAREEGRTRPARGPESAAALEPATVADLVRRAGLQDRVGGPGDADEPLSIPKQASDAPAPQR